MKMRNKISIFFIALIVLSNISIAQDTINTKTLLSLSDDF